MILIEKVPPQKWANALCYATISSDSFSISNRAVLMLHMLVKRLLRRAVRVGYTSVGVIFFIPPYLKRDHRLVYLIVWLAVIIRQICKYWRPIETLNQPSRVHKRLAKRPTGRCYWEQQLPQELHIPDAFVWSRWWTGMVFVDSKRQKKELATSFGKAKMCSTGDSNQATVWCGTSLNCSCSCLH